MTTQPDKTDTPLTEDVEKHFVDEVDHMREPWIVYSDKNSEIITILDADKNHHSPVVHWMGFDDAKNNYGEDLKNAKRIVSCVNALAGKNPEALEGVIKHAQSLMNGIETGMVTLDTPADETLANTLRGLSKALKALQGETG